MCKYFSKSRDLWGDDVTRIYGEVAHCVLLQSIYLLSKFRDRTSSKSGNVNIYNPSQNISDKLWFFCEIAPYGKSLISIFQDFFASIDKISILGARTRIVVWSLILTATQISIPVRYAIRVLIVFNWPV